MIGPLLASAVATGNPVLLVHGIDDTTVLFDVLRPALEAQGWVVEAFDMRPNNGDAGLSVLGAQVAERAAHLLRRTGARQLDLVAFSMGGLASRYYLQRLGGADRVGRFVCLSSPHEGTWTAYLRWNLGAADMRPNSPFLTDLNRDWAATAARVRTTVLWTPFDLMILPAASSRLTGAREEVLPVALHPWMVRDARSLEAIKRALREPYPSSESSASSSR